jgi:hypothetical protein
LAIHVFYPVCKFEYRLAKGVNVRINGRATRYARCPRKGANPDVSLGPRQCQFLTWR